MQERKLLAGFCSTRLVLPSHLSSCSNSYSRISLLDMHSTLIRMAESISSKPLNLTKTSATLLPPKPCVLVYRSYPQSLTIFYQIVPTTITDAPRPTFRNAFSGRRLCQGRLGIYIFPLNLSWRVPLLEFRRHRAVTNPAHIIGFLSQWKMYLDELPRGPDAKNWGGKKLDATVFEKVWWSYISCFKPLLTIYMSARGRRCRPNNLDNSTSWCTLRRTCGNQ